MKSATNKSPVQLLEESKGRHASLVSRRAKVQFELEAAERQLTEAKAEAEREYGTSDLDALRALYAERESENARNAEQFLASLSEVEQQIAQIEQALAS